MMPNPVFMRKHTAFVLGLFDTGLAAVRSLGRAGVPVIGVDSDPGMPGVRSRYCTAKVCADPVHQPEDMLRFMLNEGRQLDHPGVIFPTSDAFVLFCSRYRDDLQQYFSLALPSAEILEAVVNKRKQYELAEKVGMPYATTFYPETIDDVNSIKDQVSYPAFIKPYYGHLWREKFGGNHKGFKVHSPQELVTRFRDVEPTGLQTLVQSIILGPNTNHYKVSVYINTPGTPLAIFTLRKIRQYPTEFGVGTVVESVRYPELVEMGLRFFRGICYRGVGSIEIKRDERDGRLKMIELNPRLWQQNMLATVCGMNFPLIQYLDLTGQDPTPQTEFLEHIKWLDMSADFQAFWEYSLRGELSLWNWLRSLNGTKAFSVFAGDDLQPTLASLDYGLKVLRLPLYMIRNHSAGKSETNC